MHSGLGVLDAFIYGSQKKGEIVILACANLAVLLISVLFAKPFYMRIALSIVVVVAIVMSCHIYDAAQSTSAATKDPGNRCIEECAQDHTDVQPAWLRSQSMLTIPRGVLGQQKLLNI